MFGLPEATRGPGPRRRRHPARAAQARAGPGRRPDLHRPAGRAPPRRSGSGWPTGWCRPARRGQPRSSWRGRSRRNSPVAVRAAKQALRQRRRARPGGRRWTSRTRPGGRRPLSADRREGIAAFTEKRAPPGRAGEPESGPAGDGTGGRHGRELICPRGSRCARSGRGTGCRTRTRCRPGQDRADRPALRRPACAGSRPSRSSGPRRSRRWPTRTRSGRGSTRAPAVRYSALVPNLRGRPAGAGRRVHRDRGRGVGLGHAQPQERQPRHRASRSTTSP